MSLACARVVFGFPKGSDSDGEVPQDGGVVASLQNDVVPAFGRGMPRELMSYLIPKIEPILVFFLVSEQGCHWQNGDERAALAWQEGFRLFGGCRGGRLRIAIARSAELCASLAAWLCFVTFHSPYPRVYQ